MGEKGLGVLDPAMGNWASLSLSGRLCLGCSGREWSGWVGVQEGGREGVGHAPALRVSCEEAGRQTGRSG